MMVATAELTQGAASPGARGTAHSTEVRCLEMLIITKVRQ